MFLGGSQGIQPRFRSNCGSDVHGLYVHDPCIEAASLHEITVLHLQLNKICTPQAAASISHLKVSARQLCENHKLAKKQLPRLGFHELNNHTAKSGAPPIVFLLKTKISLITNKQQLVPHTTLKQRRLSFSQSKSREKATALFHYHKLCSRVSNIWGNRRDQHILSAVEKARPGKAAFVITIPPC